MLIRIDAARAKAEKNRVTRYSQADALFDHRLMAWDVDLFAAPGDPGLYTTTDGETFLRLQRTALEQRCAANKRHLAVKWDVRTGPRLPHGFRLVAGGDASSPGRVDWVIWAINDLGRPECVVARDEAALQQAEARMAARVKNCRARLEDAA